MVLEAPFEEENVGMAINKLLDTKEHMTLTMKIKFIGIGPLSRSRMTCMRP